MTFFVSPHREGWAVVDSATLKVVAVYHRRMDAVRATLPKRVERAPAMT